MKGSAWKELNSLKTLNASYYSECKESYELETWDTHALAYSHEWNEH